jgi:mRNA-degrading endonuclease RelE of RelBE toxin-antitoxin system
MASEPAGRIQVTFTPEFKRNLRQLAKKYRHIQTDLDPCLKELVSGKTPGDRIQRTDYEIYKVRLKNSDARKGKSGGYRVIYWKKTATELVLVTIYSKTEQADVSANEISQIISDHDSATSQKLESNDQDSSNAEIDS